MTDPTQITELRGAALAQAVAEYITAHPNEWDQGSWGVKDSCGTTACIAGTAVILSGRAVWSLPIAGQQVLVRPWDNDEDVPAKAKELLGLGTRALFYWTPGEDEEVYDSYEDTWTNPDLSEQEKVRLMWHRIAEEYPEGSIVIPEEYK